jgi:hypothetical protein
MILEVRSTNSIIGNVLANATKAMGLYSAAKAMGMPKRDKDNKADGEFVNDVQNDG